MLYGFKMDNTLIFLYSLISGLGFGLHRSKRENMNLERTRYREMSKNERKMTILKEIKYGENHF